MPLEPDHSQVSVDGFTADVLATFPVNDSRVVIENQLENTDHSHLGRILSNMARLEAQTAIWVAREFQPAHLSAVRWLNINTPGDFNFFAVRVRAVRIGDFPAPIAPIFEVLEKPHDWDRRMQAINRAVSSPGRVNDRLSRLRRKRRDFWQAYADSILAKWISLPTTHTAIFIIRWVEPWSPSMLPTAAWEYTW